MSHTASPRAKGKTIMASKCWIFTIVKCQFNWNVWRYNSSL